MVSRSDERDRLSRIRQMMIGVAGGFAQEVWRGRFHQNYVHVSDCLYMDDFMSATDWSSCGASPDEWPLKLARAAERVVALLQSQLRQEWLRASRTLMRDGVLLSAKASTELIGRVLAAREYAIRNAAVLVTPAVDLSSPK